MSRSLLVENSRTINSNEEKGVNESQYILQKRNVPRTILGNVTNNANILQEISMNRKIGMKNFSKLNTFFPLKDEVSRADDFTSSFNDSRQGVKQEVLNNKENIPEYGYSEQEKQQSSNDDSLHTNSTALSCNRLIYSENKSISTQMEWQKKIMREDSKKKRPISTLVEQDDQKKFKFHEFTTEEEVLEEYEWDDLDEEDCDDPLMVSEEVNDIFDYLHHLEIITLPNKANLYKHKNIKQNRDILVNWIIKIHNKFGLLPETLYLAINIMDRFLCEEVVQLNRLQLVGTSCLFIASKYEEIYSPSIKHFAYETDGACSVEDIKEGERFILEKLDFQISFANPMNFLRRISKADDYDIQSRTLAKFLMEISIVDFKFIGILPSLCASAAMFLSRKMLGKGTWDGNLIHYSGGYTKAKLYPVCQLLMDYLVGSTIHDEFLKKYQSRRFLKASIISIEWALKVRKNGYDIMTLHE
ncbi:BAH_G0020670.mRNA.1.CDS.1 [Saccharomyces cerevisiae]|nr:SX2_G0039520.mRNA.1.CDS.1 [Saccharomyces cerevisiae]CAI4499101.1 BAG_1a_G0020790.mRNA.1.CDS.1 [Saccharomyces cerevisiae]CAI4500541.1 BAH_G0020670.mRNA.1.CDS.1 [Saccharomyces cerevisiae]CAI7135186.1 BAG_1a_G0020790.mRNA.1.CDS.1 [Saccharomyces cerevisiae]CAI7135711.1 BAH_G0020670.mRNA.1.CDS.1 [Saccharomyces cerevisiae]